MRAVLVQHDGDRATVRLVPSWLARLFGAREALVELEWYEEGKGTRRYAGWLATGSRRWLDEIRYHAIIDEALDMRIVEAPPTAKALPPNIRIVK